MLMYLVIAILFAITVGLAFIEERLKDSQKASILAGYALFMVLLATTKSVEHTADAAAYESMFLNNTNALTEVATEPTFIWLSRIVLACGGTIGVMFFIYAVITIPAKMKALYTMTPYIFTALMVYIPVYFEVLDMVQIRAAAASTFLVASLIPIADKRYLLAALLILCGVMFHYSAVVYLPFLFVGNRRLNAFWRWTIAVLVPACFVMYLMKKDLFSLIPASLTEGKLDFYQNSSEKGEWGELAVLYKNAYFISKCVVLYLCLYFYDYIAERNRMAPLLINLFAASILFLLSMATIPVLAGRVSDLYGVTDCIVFTFCLYLVNPPYISRVAIAIVGAYMLVYNMIFADYFT